MVPRPSSSSVPITTSSGLKRGLAYNDISLTKDFNSGYVFISHYRCTFVNFMSLIYREVSWAYNWGSSYSGSLPSGVVFFPMLWGSDAGHTNTWIADANAAIAAGATHLLG